MFFITGNIFHGLPLWLVSIFSNLFNGSILAAVLLTISLILAFYPIFVIVIRRLHDLNLPGWYCIIVVLTRLDFLLLPFLILAKGNPKINKYGEIPLHFKGPSFVLFGSYAVLGLYLAGLVLIIVVLTRWVYCCFPI